MPIKQALAEPSPYVETAGRLRNTPDRGQMHTGRDAEIDARNTSRLQAEADAFTWINPTNLDAPPPLPGMRQKWIRMGFRSESDEINWANRYRQGWRPRTPDTIPEELRGNYPMRDHHRDTMIRVGNLVLCHIEERRVLARTKMIKDLINQQSMSIAAETDKISREGVRAGQAPLVRDEQLESVSGGRRPPTLAD